MTYCSLVTQQQKKTPLLTGKGITRTFSSQISSLKQTIVSKSCDGLRFYYSSRLVTAGASMQSHSSLSTVIVCRKNGCSGKLIKMTLEAAKSQHVVNWSCKLDVTVLLSENMVNWPVRSSKSHSRLRVTWYTPPGEGHLWRNQRTHWPTRTAKSRTFVQHTDWTIHAESYYGTSSIVQSIVTKWQYSWVSKPSANLSSDTKTMNTKACRNYRPTNRELETNFEKLIKQAAMLL
jgi:hypothetical protein